MKISILQPQVIQELGCRNNQEDSVFPKLNETTLEDRLFVLCDGMGGHENGEVASQLVCDVLPAYIKKRWDGGVFTDELLQNAIDEVYNRINEYQSDSLRKMGTTLTFLCIHKGGVMMAHIGDSRIYHIRPSEHLILYKSRDHSLAYDLFLAGEISYDELTTYKKNVITRAIMPGLEHQPKADIVHSTNIKEGDYLFMCSDGMLEQMSDDELLIILSSDLPDEKKREIMIGNTKENKDNHSAFIIHIGKIEKINDDSIYANDELTSRSNAVKEKDSTGLKKERIYSHSHKSLNNLVLKTIVLIVALLAFLMLLIKTLI